NRLLEHFLCAAPGPGRFPAVHRSAGDGHGRRRLGGRPAVRGRGHGGGGRRRPVVEGDLDARGDAGPGGADAAQGMVEPTSVHVRKDEDGTTPTWSAAGAGLLRPGEGQRQGAALALEVVAGGGG